jgi:hypothetical protein
LTSLDERVLAVLDSGRGQRARHIANVIHARTGEVGGYGRRKPSVRQLAEVRRILRGFEHLGRASCRGGWWRAT